MDLEPPTRPFPGPAVEPQSLPQRPFGAGRALAILATFLLVQIAVALVVAMVAQSHYGAKVSNSQELAAKVEAVTLLPAALIGTLLGALVALKMTRRSFPGSVRSGSLTPLGWSTASPRTVVAGAVLGLLICVPITYLLTIHFPPRPGQSFGPLTQAATNPGLARLGWTLLALFIAPPVEEFLFRGVLLQGFTRTWSLRTGVLLASSIFVAFHIPETRFYWPALTGISLLAAATATVRLVTKSLAPAIGVHFGYNLGVVILVFARAA